MCEQFIVLSDPPQQVTCERYSDFHIIHSASIESEPGKIIGQVMWNFNVGTIPAQSNLSL